MGNTKRGKSLATRQAVAASNMRRKIVRLHRESSSIAAYMDWDACPFCKKPFNQCEYFQQLEDE